MDSWYPSKALVEACLKKEFHVITMLKTNRILYQKDVAVQAKQFARYIHPEDTHLVTVGGKTSIGCISMKARWKV